MRQNPRATVRFDASSDSTEKKTAEKARRIVKDEENPKYESYSGMATLENAIQTPYTLDSGADRSVISEGLVKRLRDENVFVRTKLGEEITLVLGDESEVKVNELVLLDVEFETLNSKVKLRDIEFRVIPGKAEEILVGKSEMKRLNIPTLESMLDKVALDQSLPRIRLTSPCKRKLW